MTKSLRKTIILASLIFLVPLSAIWAAQDDGVYTYVFHLYFDNGTLVKDRDFENSFELVAEEYQYVGGKTEKEYYAYYVEIVSVTGSPMADVSVTVPDSGKGKISPRAPYYDNAKTANFYNFQRQKLLTIDLAPSGPVCNEDKQCNNDTGETVLNCPSDCQTPIFPTDTPLPDGMIDNIPWLLNILIVLVVVTGVIILWWLRKRRKSSEIPSPQI